MPERVYYGFLFLASLVVTTGISLALPNVLEQAAVAESGHLVTVEIVGGSRYLFKKLPSYDLHFLYYGNEYSTRVSVEYFQQVKDQPTAQLLHLPLYPDIFFEPEHSEEGEILSASLLIVCFVGIMLWSLFKLIKAGQTRRN